MLLSTPPTSPGELTGISPLALVNITTTTSTSESPTSMDESADSVTATAVVNASGVTSSSSSDLVSPIATALATDAQIPSKEGHVVQPARATRTTRTTRKSGKSGITRQTAKSVINTIMVTPLSQVVATETVLSPEPSSPRLALGGHGGNLDASGTE